LHGQGAIVEAQLAAGVPPDGIGTATLRPLAAAAGAGCALGQGDLEGRLAAIDALVAAGADVEGTDRLGNTLLMQSAMVCPLPVIQRLVELGANPAPAPNAQGATPLGGAFINGKWDMAEYLIGRGARLDAEQIDSIFFELPTDPTQRALVDSARKEEK
jgi:ankyrin repeat protein